MKAQVIHDEPNSLWADRRTHTGHETAQALAGKLNESNWREHPDDQAGAVDESLDSLGWVGSVKINVTTGRLIDGHLRVKRALLKDPQAPVPVDYYDLTEEEEDLALQVLDASTEMATPNADKLAALMDRTRAMVVDKPALRGMLDALKARAGVNGQQEPQEDTPPIDKAAELQEKWGTALGQVWELGKHRVVCGDCTDRAVVEAVMRGERANNLVTDPPFNVGFNYKSSNFDDNKPLDEYGSWLWKTISLSEDFLDKPFAVFVWQPILTCRYWSEWIPRDFRLFASLKDFVQFRPTPVQYSWDPILFWRSGESTVQPIAGKRDYFMSQTSRFVLEESSGHPCPRPIDVCNYIIDKLCEQGSVLDPFLGSGTTLIACEQLNRRCRGIEIHPPYVAVTLERYHTLTGDTPRLVGG